MQNLSNVDIHEFLSRCDGSKVEHRRVEHEGRQYYIPYSTVKIQNKTIEGLRENGERIDLLRGIINDNVTDKNSYLDVGSNLGVFVKSLSDLFDSVNGVDYEDYYIGQSKFLYPEISDSFQRVDLNQTRLTEVFKGQKFSTITALSMIEYINDKPQFIQDLHGLTDGICIVEGHSEDIKLGHDKKYELLLQGQPWSVERLSDTTDAGVNAPRDTQETGRPIWVCRM